MHKHAPLPDSDHHGIEFDRLTITVNASPDARSMPLFACRRSEPVRTAAVWLGLDMAHGIGAASWSMRTQDSCYHLSWATLS
jgi:hypothetical protein